MNKTENTAANMPATNPMICDIETGVCELPDTTANETVDAVAGSRPVKVIYFTDPICSSCWGIEPQLHRLKLEYGNALEFEYRMGGLLPDWSYNSGGISKPSDVAHHWDEVSLHYDMPIDGDVWLEDPLDSSYPPSIAFKAAQMQSEKLALHFLRVMREMVFLQKKNIAKMPVIEEAVKASGLDLNRFRKNWDAAKTAFNADLELARKMGVRGFPTLFFTNAQGQVEKVYGSKPYAVFEQALAKVHPAATKQGYDKSLTALFKQWPSLTAREYAALAGIDRRKAQQELNEQVKAGNLRRLDTKNGSLWSRR